MASHARGGAGRWVYGSVTEDVLRHSEVPVIVVPEGYTRGWLGGEPLRMVVALDGSDVAEEALAPAGELAGLTGGELVLTRVVAPSHELEDYRYAVRESGEAFVADVAEDGSHLRARVEQADAYLADAADRVRGLAPRVSIRVELGDVADGLIGAGVATGAHLIVMATHRRGELARLLSGSHAIATLRRADVPVMMVRPPARPAVAASAQPDWRAASGGRVPARR
jgi:nucleotide-binding universal stress UspA family protein